MHPLLDEFFNYTCSKSSAIRVHCVTKEERLELRNFVAQYFPTFFDEYIVADPSQYYYHTYFFWDRSMYDDDNGTQTRIGFNSYNYGNENSYEFAEFMAIVSCPMEDDITDMEGLV